MATAKAETSSVPRLAELYIPCPICGGTTNTLSGTVFCESCDQEWTVMGTPIKYKVEWRLQ